MFFNSFMPKPTFGSSGSKKSGRSRADRKGASASLAPAYSPTPKLRPKTIKSETTSHSGPNMDGSAGYTRTTSSNSKGKVGPTKIKTSNGDSVTANGSSGMRIGNKIINTPKDPPHVKANKGIGKTKAPVNVDSDKSSGGSAAGSSGGTSGKIKASKAQEDNLTVKRKSRGTSKYKLSTNNPLVVNKKNRNS